MGDNIFLVIMFVGFLYLIIGIYNLSKIKKNSNSSDTKEQSGKGYKIFTSIFNVVIGIIILIFAFVFPLQGYNNISLCFFVLGVIFISMALFIIKKMIIGDYTTGRVYTNGPNKGQVNREATKKMRIFLIAILFLSAAFFGVETIVQINEKSLFDDSQHYGTCSMCGGVQRCAICGKPGLYCENASYGSGTDHYCNDHWGDVVEWHEKENK